LTSKNGYALNTNALIASNKAEKKLIKWYTKPLLSNFPNEDRTKANSNPNAPTQPITFTIKL